jgi:hypothetical protein
VFNFSLASLALRPSKRPIVLANIKPTQAQADTLAALYLRAVGQWGGRRSAFWPPIHPRFRSW